MNKSTQMRLAWTAVWGVMLLSICIGVLPNIAMLESGDGVLTALGLIMILSIPVMEIAAALLAYTVLSQDKWTMSRRMCIAIAGLAMAVAWNSYNVKRGLDMAPQALAAREAAFASLAQERSEYAREARDDIIAAQREGRYINSRALDVSASRADREALEFQTKASLISMPHTVMLLILALAMKLIELTLLYVVSTNRPHAAKIAAKRAPKALLSSDQAEEEGARETPSSGGAQDTTAWMREYLSRPPTNGRHH